MAIEAQKVWQPTSSNSKQEYVLHIFKEMQQWPHWHEVYLNCVKESTMSYEAFAQAVQASDDSREAFDKALTNSRLTQAEFDRYLPEFQKYMALLTAYSDVGMLSDGVDAIWHGFMLVSSRYYQFCYEFFDRVIHHMPCSSYELYGVHVQDATSSCISKCLPTSCKGEGGGGGCKEAPHNYEQTQKGILSSTKIFCKAYKEVFGVMPSLEIWNQLGGTRRFVV